MSNPITPISISATAELLNTLCNIAREHEIQKTKRFEIEKKSEITKSYLETQFKVFEVHLNKLGVERMQIIAIIGEITKKSELNEFDLSIIDRFLSFLVQPSMSYTSIEKSSYAGLFQNTSQSSSYISSNEY